MEKNYYIFTEIVQCGKIGKIAITSFHKYHDQVIHIYGTPEDFSYIDYHPNNVFIEVKNEILLGYKHGHIGTALLWEHVIKTVGSKYIIHLDSDVIFRENIINEMIEKSSSYDIIGPIRNYHHNPYTINACRHLTDVCQTSCFLFNREKISNNLFKKKTLPQLNTLLTLNLIQIARNTKWFLKHLLIKEKITLSTFARMIHGTYCPFPFRTIDFFDPIMFDMVLNGAKIYHLDFNDVGGTNYYGSRKNNFAELNDFPTPAKIDFGKKVIHFSSVGSGMNFYTNKENQNNVVKSYVDYAIDRYALFCKIFYNETIEGVDISQYKNIIENKHWY